VKESQPDLDDPWISADSSLEEKMEQMEALHG
jgi:hypothetical protein